MAHRLRDSECAAVIEQLEAESVEERSRAAGTIYQWVYEETCSIHRGPSQERVEYTHDIAADITLKLASKREVRRRLLEARSPAHFVRAMIRNAIIDKYRSRRRQVFEPLTESRESELEDPGELSEVADVADAITHLWSEISDEERELLRMRFWENRSFPEIAQELGISYAAAAQRVYRLMAKARYLLHPVQAPVTSVPASHPGTSTGTRIRQVAQHGASAERFRKLADAWRENCGPTSSLTEMAMRPEYQQIIGMGRDAVPLLLEELKRQPDHWFWALVAITGEDPVPAEHKGRLPEMTEAWLQWGKDHGYLESKAT